jgi:ADP-ribose pyrophosphatase YjhB (NUDIX family)
MSARNEDPRGRFPVAVHLFFFSDDRVLLLRRFNTGWEDGKYSIPAGHVEAGESVTQAAVREADEEIGVRLTPEMLEVVHVMHRRSDDARVDFFFLVREWAGDISNREPHRCDDLAWYPLDALPEATIPYVRRALECYRNGESFSEYGW